YAQTVITASIAAGSSVNFTETTSGVDPTAANAPLVTVQLLSGANEITQTGPAGSTGTTPITVKVFAIGIGGFQLIPNTLVKLVPADPTGPLISCSGATGYTDTNGTANCLPVFGGQITNGRYFVDVGGAYRTFGPFSFNVTQGQFSNLRIISGNNQSGAPGTQLPIQLSARTEAAAGNP